MQSLADEIGQIRAIKNHDLDVVYRTLFNLLNSTLRTASSAQIRPNITSATEAAPGS